MQEKLRKIQDLLAGFVDGVYCFLDNEEKEIVGKIESLLNTEINQRTQESDDLIELEGYILRDISHEEWREYRIIGKRGVRILNPRAVYIPKEKEHGHIVVKMNGEAVWIKPGFDYILWKNKKGYPRVSF